MMTDSQEGSGISTQRYSRFSVGAGFDEKLDRFIAITSDPQAFVVDAVVSPRHLC